MNAAIVGCGLIAGVHAASLKALGHTVALVVGRELDTAKAFSETWGIASYSDGLSEELLQDIDCVHICTPSVSHYELVKKCLKLNKNVICEKPLCLSGEHSKELMLLAQEKNLVNAVNFNVRYYDACSKAKEIVSQQAFGRPVLVQCSYQQEFHALPETYSWRYQSEHAGHLRATTEIGSHCIDLIHHWTDLKISSVSANFGNFSPVRYLLDGVMYREPIEGSIPVDVESEDAAIISLKFDNGAIGSIVLSEVSHGRSNSLKLEVTGEGQSVWWDSETPYHLNSAQKGSGVNTAVNAFSQNFSDTITLFIESVYRDIGSEVHQKSYPGFADGFFNTLVCDAIYSSAKNNSNWVQVQEC